MISLKEWLSKHQNKPRFNLDDSGLLSSDFPGLRIFVVSMTSTASTASVASMTSTASFHIANRAETLQRQDAKKKKSIGPILFLYYEESLVASNLNPKLFRFHCVRPNIHT